ncbi:MAG: hypothetical protein QOE70_2717 [Chthoniobacter sp.]|jgi:NAD(P)-dependent dehydrogenase (short-subunit alcohol dehydrogenase family)|nr:hypothetical protein [Chthoniobacter sp.]
MIADLRGQLALVADAESGMHREIRDAFERQGATCLDLDASEPAPALAAARERAGRVDALIVGRRQDGVVAGIEDFTEVSLSGGTSRLFKLIVQIKNVLGAFPRYAIGLSTPAPDHFAAGEDLRAAGDAAMETLCRYANYRLIEEDLRINVIRFRPLPSDFAKRHTPPHLRSTERDVANAAVALCSGLMDSVRGQVLTVDRGATFCDSLMRIYSEGHSAGF